MSKQLSAFDQLTKRGGFLESKLGKGWSAPFTGYTWRAFRAYVDLVDAWYQTDNRNRVRIQMALHSVVESLQPSELEAARMAIYGLGNEDAMIQLWSLLEWNTPTPTLKGQGAKCQP